MYPDTVTAFQSENDRRATGVKCLLNLDGGRGQDDVRTLSVHPDPAQLFLNGPPGRPPPPGRRGAVTNGVSHYRVDSCRRKLVEKEQRRHGPAGSPAIHRCRKGRKIVRGVNVGVNHHPFLESPPARVRLCRHQASTVVMKELRGSQPTLMAEATVIQYC